MRLTDGELDTVERRALAGKPPEAGITIALVDEVRLSRAAARGGPVPRDPSTWTNERCPTHGRFRCSACLGVPDLPGARGGKGSLTSVVLAGKAMRGAQAAAAAAATKADFTGAAFCRCGAVEFAVPSVPRVRVNGEEHTPAGCGAEIPAR
jgi:hypothetical protein